jgi:hypothetical protein
MKANLSGAIDHVRLPMWVRPKGSGWTVKPVPVAVYGRETSDAAESFAGALRASFEAHRTAWEADHAVVRVVSIDSAGRPPVRSQRNASGRVQKRADPQGSASSRKAACSRCGRTFRAAGSGLAWHASRCAA